MSTSAITTPQLMRLKDLSAAGLSDAAVGKVLKLDAGVDVNRHQVRYYRLKYSHIRKPVRGVPFGSAS